MKKRILFFSAFFLWSAHLAYAGFGDLLQKVSAVGSGAQTSQTGDAKIASGLKEALRVGFEKTVSLLGQRDGYLKNEAIKIPLPSQFKKAEGLLRTAGFGNQIDNLVLSMNRSAEAAAPQAKALFLSSIQKMTFDDVKKIYQGGDQAATHFLREKTYEDLKSMYKPVIAKKMAENQVSGLYQNAVSKYKTLPLSKNFKAPEVEDYVVRKSLDGLFKMLGEQEKLIRTDPAARVTQILKDVFTG